MTSINFELYKAQIYHVNELLFLDQCQELDRKYFAWPWSIKNWDELSNNLDRYFYLVLGDESQAEGLALFYLPPAEPLAHLLKLVLTPKVRNQGWGEKFLSKAIADLQKLNYREFYLEVEEGNVPAIKLYQKLGFNILCVKKNFYGNERNALAMKYTVKNT